MDVAGVGVKWAKLMQHKTVSLKVEAMEVNFTEETSEMLKISSGIHLLTENTPNGKKVQILLEELYDIYGLSWATHLIDLETDEQKKPWFLALNPNGKIPVLLDYAPDGSNRSVMESSAILVYLQEHFDEDNVFGFESASERSQMLQWLFFWHSASSVHGNARQFMTSDKENTSDAAEHFRKEMLRIYSVVEEHLSGKYRAGVSRDYLAGNGRGKYSIADMGIWPRAQAYRSLGFADEDMGANFPCLVSWIEKVARREAVMRGIDGAKYDSEDNPSLALRTS